MTDESKRAHAARGARSGFGRQTDPTPQNHQRRASKAPTRSNTLEPMAIHWSTNMTTAENDIETALALAREALVGRASLDAAKIELVGAQGRLRRAGQGVPPEFSELLSALNTRINAAVRGEMLDHAPSTGTPHPGAILALARAARRAVVIRRAPAHLGLRALLELRAIDGSARSSLYLSPADLAGVAMAATQAREALLRLDDRTPSPAPRPRPSQPHRATRPRDDAPPAPGVPRGKVAP